MLEKPAAREDEWGRDPQVRSLRRIFNHMESAQSRFLERLQIGPWDDRLRDLREKALIFFESVWAGSRSKGVFLEVEEMSDLYLYCLAHLCVLRNIEIPAGTLPPNQKIENLIKEKPL